VPGWFGQLDARIFVAIDALQGARGIRGDLLEIGVYQGQSAVLLGFLPGKGERLVVCDVFEAHAGLSEENAAEVSTSYDGLRQEEFERQYLRFHAALPTILAAQSTSIDRRGLAGSFRFVHVDGSHLYDVVREDVATARSLLGRGGVVVFDDWMNLLVPGVALAVWEEYLRGHMIPLCLTPSKLYATWDPWGLTPADLDTWATAQPDVVPSELVGLGAHAARLYTAVDPPLRGFLRELAPPLLLSGYRRLRRRVYAQAARLKVRAIP
jgi:hypothetical protein